MAQSAFAADEIFCNGFESITLCPGNAAPFLLVPNRASALAATPFSTYLSTAGSATNLALLGPTGQNVPLLISAQVGNRVDAVIPAGLAPGLWSVQTTVDGNVGEYLQALLITSTTTSLALSSLTPAVVSNQALTRADLGASDPAPVGTEDFVVMPEVFLLPQGGGNAVRIDDREFVSTAHVETTIPAGLAAGIYDVIAINADGATGLLSSGLTVVISAAPTIAKRVPQVSRDIAGEKITVYGANFGASFPNIAAVCVDSLGNSAGTVAGVVSALTASSVSANFDFSTMSIGSTCRIDLTTTDGLVARFANQPISNTSFNLGNSSDTGQTLLQGRRGGVLLAGPTAPEGHRLYMIGGDDGTVPGAMSSIESAAIDGFGALGAFRAEKYALPQALTLAGGVTVGDYLYVVGGNNGLGSANTAYRSRVLRDLRDPAFATLGATPALTPSGNLSGGLWSYRIAPLISASDTDNPNGEGLPGAELSVDLPATPNGIQVVLSFSSTIANVTSYAIYRTPTAGAATFERLAVVPNAGGTTTYTDTGTATTAGQSPLPVGSLANWFTLPLLSINREGAAVTMAVDPATAGTAYVYAIAGKQSATLASTSYEYLSITTAADGHQTSAAAWTAGTITLAAARAYLSVWSATADTAPGVITGTDTYIYAGPGASAAGTSVAKVEAGKVSAGGQIMATIAMPTTWDDTPKDDTSGRFGGAAAQGVDELFLVGGQFGQPSGSFQAATMITPAPTLSPGSWNLEGATLAHGVIYAGFATTDGFIYIAGGQTDKPSPADTFVQRVQQ